MKLQTGIWFDYNEAFLIDIQGNMETQIRHIYCPDSPSAFLEDLDSEFLNPIYMRTGKLNLPLSECKGTELFEKVQKAVNSSDEIIIFGLEKTVNKFIDFTTREKKFKSKILRTEFSKETSLTKKVAKVETYFRKKYHTIS